MTFTQRIKRPIRIGTVTLAVLLLTGCLEVTQHIGSGPNNTVESFVRVTLQRSIFSFAEAFGGSAPSDDEFAREFGMTEEEILEEMPGAVEAHFESVITDFDYGFSLRTTTPRDFAGERTQFLPVVTPDEIRIPLPPGDGEDAGEAAFFLASAKYRILIDKSLLPSVSSAQVTSGPGRATPVAVTEFQSVWLVEFPVILWLEGGDDAMVVIR